MQDWRQVCVCVYVRARACVCLHMRVCTCACACVCACVHGCVYAHTDTCVFVYREVPILQPSAFMLIQHALSSKGNNKRSGWWGITPSPSLPFHWHLTHSISFHPFIILSLSSARYSHLITKWSMASTPPLPTPYSILSSLPTPCHLPCCGGI